MNNKKKRIIFYILSITALVFLIAYMITTTLPIVKVDNDSINMYQMASSFNGLKSTPFIVISLVFVIIGVSLAIVWPILYLCKVKHIVYLLLICFSLPFLAFSLVSNLFIVAIYKSVNFGYSGSISAILLPLIIQNLLLSLSILINIFSIFYLSISQYKVKLIEREEVNNG